MAAGSEQGFADVTSLQRTLRKTCFCCTSEIYIVVTLSDARKNRPARFLATFSVCVGDGLRNLRKVDLEPHAADQRRAIFAPKPTREATEKLSPAGALVK